MDPGGQALPAEEKFDCFLSYNRKDRDLVRYLDERLRAEAELRPWFDEYTIPGGELFDPFIRSALSRCAVVIICLGPHGWGTFQRKEADIALDLRKTTELRVILALLPQIPEADRASARERFRDENWVDFGDDIDGEEAFWALSKGIAPHQIQTFEGPARLSLFEVRKIAREWQKSDRQNVDLLFRGTRLEQASAIAATYSDRINPITQAFLLASKDAELAGSRRKIRIASAVGLALAFLSGFALWQWRVSATQARTATAGQLAARAETLRIDDANRLEQGLLLGLESLSLEETPSGRQTVINGTRWLVPHVKHFDRKGLVNLMQFSKDARSLLIASGDKIELWDVPTSEKKVTLTDPDEVTAITLASSSVGQLLASGTSDGDFSLRKLPALDPQFTIRLGARVEGIDVGPEGSPILVRTRGARSLHAIDPRIGRTVEEGPLADARAAAYSSDASYLAMLDKDHVLRLQSTASTHIQAITIPDVEAFQMSGGGDYVCLDKPGHEIQVWSLREGKKVAAARAPDDLSLWVCAAKGANVFRSGVDRFDSRDMENGLSLGAVTVPKGMKSLVASPDQAYLGVHRFASLAQLRNLRTGTLAGIMPVLGQSGVLAFSPDGTLIAADDWDNRVFLFKADFHPGYYRVPMEAVGPTQLARRIRQMDFRKRDRLLVIANRFGAFEWNLTSPTPGVVFRSSADQRAFRISSDQHRVLTVGAENMDIQLREVGGSSREIWRGESGRALTDAQFSSDGRWLAVVSKDRAEVREARSGSVQFTLDPEASAVTFDATGEFLAVVAKNTCVWNVSLKQRLYCAPEVPTSVALSPGGRKLALGMDEFLFIRQQGVDEPVLRIPHAGVRILAFSSRGQYLAAAGGSFDTASGVARIWNSTTGVEEAAIAHLENGLPRSPSALAFSPDDETLVTADLEVLLHHWRDAGIKKDACDRLTRNLTKDEWNQFFPGDSYRRTCDNLPPYGEGRLVRTVERVPLFNN